jgi:hypothetical protein
MAEAASSVPPSGIGQLHLSDFFKGLIKSVAGLFIGVLIKTIHERQLPNYDEIAPILEAAVYFLVGYLGINAATNNVGQLFTKDKPVVAVSAKKLDEVIDEANKPK